MRRPIVALDRSLPAAFVLCVGLLSGALAGPMVVTAADEVAKSIKPNAPLTTIGGIAISVARHPALAEMFAVVSLAFVVWLVGYQRHGQREFNILWGAVKATLPDATIRAQEDIARAERLRDAAEDIVNDFVALLAIVSSLTDATAPHEALDALEEVCGVASRAVGGGVNLRVSIWLFDRRTSTLKIRASHRVGRATVRRLELKPGEGLAGAVYAVNKAKALPDISRFPAGDYSPDPAAAKTAVSAMAWPVYERSVDSDPVGAICFSHSSRRAEDQLDSVALTRALPYATLVSHVLAVSRLAKLELNA